MKNKRMVISISIVVLILLSVSTLLFIQYKQKISISKNLMNEYLNNYKSKSKTGNEIISDYKLENIKLSSGNLISTKFSFVAVFSVKPVNSNSTWIAGNGELGQNGWIKNKHKEVTVTKEDGKYIIKTIGNG